MRIFFFFWNKTVYYGTMTWEEMMFPFFGVVVPKGHRSEKNNQGRLRVRGWWWRLKPTGNSGNRHESETTSSRQRGTRSLPK